MTGWADFSPCGRYRWRLVRSLAQGMYAAGGPPLTFVMLNPSTADATVDDPTVRRCIGFARREQARELRVVNLFAWRSTYPAGLWQCPDVTPRSQELGAWSWGCSDGARVVLAFGAPPRALAGAPLYGYRRMALMEHLGRVAEAVPSFFGGVYVLGWTADGSPRHPLYVRRDAPLRRIDDTLLGGVRS